MIETLLGGLLGGAFRLAPEVLKWFDRQGERGHELAMQDKALEFEKLRGAQRMSEIAAAAEGAWNTGAIETPSVRTCRYPEWFWGNWDGRDCRANASIDYRLFSIINRGRYFQDPGASGQVTSRSGAAMAASHQTPVCASSSDIRAQALNLSCSSWSLTGRLAWPRARRTGSASRVVPSVNRTDNRSCGEKSGSSASRSVVISTRTFRSRACTIVSLTASSLRS